MTINTVGKYPTTLLLYILIDGYEWSARGFWAQIKSNGSKWFKNDEIFGDPDPSLTVNTNLMEIREIGDGEEDVYIFDGGWTQHRTGEDEGKTACNISIEPEQHVFDEDTHILGDGVLANATECPTCIKWVAITLDKLAEALDWARDNYSHLLAPWTVDKGGIITDINYDAIGADIVIQKIVLGEVIYG